MELYELLKQKKVTANAERGLSAETTEDERKQIKAAEETLYRMLVGDHVPVTLSHKEAITSRDYPHLLQRVINDRLLLPIEPAYIGQSLLSTTIQVGRTVGSYSIPAFGYLEAKEVGESQDYPEQTAEFNRNATSVSLKKYGIRVAVTAEMLDADELGLFGMHIQAAKLAMNRKKEEVIFSLFKNVTGAVFDNNKAFTDNTTAPRGTSLGQSLSTEQLKWNTNGRDANGDLNGTLHIFDVIDTMSVLLARGYDPSDMLVNPLAWTILARDPTLNGFYLNGRWASPAQIAGSPVYSSTGPDDIAKLALPWNLNLHVTPFVQVQTPITGLASGVPYLTDIYIGSRRNGVILLQGRPLVQEAYGDIAHEIYNVRLKEYYGVGLADMGRSWAAIKNIRIDRAYEYAIVKPV